MRIQAATAGNCRLRLASAYTEDEHSHQPCLSPDVNPFDKVFDVKRPIVKGRNAAHDLSHNSTQDLDFEAKAGKVYEILL